MARQRRSRGRLFILCGAVLGLALGASPADAERRCGNALSDGRFIVQGPLVDAFGEFCSVAVIPRPGSSFSSLMVVDGAEFSDEIIILSPPFAHRPGRVVTVEPSEFERSREFSHERFASRGVPRQPFVPFTTGSVGPFTTGTLGPFTTFSNSRPESGAVLGGRGPRR